LIPFRATSALETGDALDLDRLTRVPEHANPSNVLGARSGALTTVFPFGSEPFVRLREQFWLQVFADAARIDRSLTFTFAPEATVQPGFPNRVRAVVEPQGGRVVFVRLVVSPGEQEQRIGANSRRAFHKLTDVAVLRSLRNHQEAAEQPPMDLEVDTDSSTAEQTAALIVERFGLGPQAPLERYSRLP
jgi:hypothetical protein